MVAADSRGWQLPRMHKPTTHLRTLHLTLAAATTALLLAGGCASVPAGSVAAVPARAEDVASIEGMMRAFYEVVNVEPTGPRQWARDRTLYSPWIRFVAIGESVDLWTHQQLVDETEPLVRAGFHEREIFRRVRVYGNIAHVDSTYETRMGSSEKVHRGVNSVELYFDQHRWWIASVMWQSEDAAHPIPAQLLPPSGGT